MKNERAIIAAWIRTRQSRAGTNLQGTNALPQQKHMGKIGLSLRERQQRPKLRMTFADLQREAGDGGCARVGEGGGDVCERWLARRFGESKADAHAVLVKHCNRREGRGSRRGWRAKSKIGQRI